MKEVHGREKEEVNEVQRKKVPKGISRKKEAEEVSFPYR